MTKITLAVGKGFSGEIFRYEVDDESNIGELIKKFVREIYGEQEDALNFVLFNLTQKFEYENNETLLSKGTKSGDVLLLINLKKF
ncbi:hypothetical protein JGI1_00925 [Candidatus Thermokryptus mobilis]|uniref:Ubiquitin-like domain-containing protein n=1 Tax=Candidatus Thermokryptus mobilis TaxID=1643428 RepID=A0A0S4N046_9BACT|nr:hypothetical protein [Candidatus Thermokryptus mobilis]CUU04200.1 hypothetical protein JGI1_00925 [Candidatus Thermokryptus mobilis]